MPQTPWMLTFVIDCHGFDMGSVLEMVSCGENAQRMAAGAPRSAATQTATSVAVRNSYASNCGAQHSFEVARLREGAVPSGEARKRSGDQHHHDVALRVAQLLIGRVGLHRRYRFLGQREDAVYESCRGFGERGVSDSCEEKLQSCSVEK